MQFLSGLWRLLLWAIDSLEVTKMCGMLLVGALLVYCSPEVTESGRQIVYTAEDESNAEKVLFRRHLDRAISERLISLKKE